MFTSNSKIIIGVYSLRLFPLVTLTLASVLLWVISIFQSRALLLNGIGDSGLFSILPATYFVAFALLVLSFLLTLFYTKNRLMLVCQTVLLIFFLNLTPSLIEGTARFSTSYNNFRALDYLLQNAHINSQAVWPLNWPSFSVLFASFSEITSIPENFLLLVYPTFFSVLLFPALYLFFKTVINETNSVWFATWFVFLANWVGQDYFSMQSLSFLIMILILYLIFKNLTIELSSWQWFTMVLLLFLYESTSHVLTSLAILSILLLLILFKQIRKPLLLFTLLFLPIFWTIYTTLPFLETNLPAYLAQVLDLVTIFEGNVANRVSGSEGHIFVTQMRIFFALILALLAILGLLSSLKNRKFRSSNDKRMLIILIGFSLLVAAFSYGGELFQRLFLFSLIPFAYFATKLLKYKYIICAVFLFFIVFAPSFHIIAHYGNETMDYVPYSETVGAKFFFNVAPDSAVAGFFRYYNYAPQYKIVSLTQALPTNSSNTSDVTSFLLQTSYSFVCVSYFERAVALFFHGNPEFVQNIQGNLTQTSSYDLVYSNPSFDLYASKGYR